jgi:hypothetical protein
MVLYIVLLFLLASFYNGRSNFQQNMSVKTHSFWLFASVVQEFIILPRFSESEHKKSIIVQ